MAFFRDIVMCYTQSPYRKAWPSVKLWLDFSHLNKIPLSCLSKAAASLIFYIPELLLSRSASISTLLNPMTSSQSLPYLTCEQQYLTQFICYLLSQPSSSTVLPDITISCFLPILVAIFSRSCFLGLFPTFSL